MVAIKSFAQLSLSRPGSQTPSARPPNHQAPPPNPLNVVPPSNLVHRPTCNEDYYLSDDQLVLHERTNRSKLVHPTGDLSLPYNNMKLAWTGADDSGSQPPPSTKPSALGPNAFVSSNKPRHTTLLSPAAPVTNSHTIQPVPQTCGAHKPLLSSLLSVASKQSPALSRADTPLNSAPGSPKAIPIGTTSPSGPNVVQLQQLEASYVSKVATRLRDLVNKVFPSAIENGLGWLGRSAPRVSCAVELGEALKYELAVSSCDSYILRSLLRTAAIPALTVYSGRLDPLLILPTSERSVLFVPKSVKDVDHALPIGLRYNIEVVRCIWAVRSAIEDILAGDKWDKEVTKALKDGLGPFGAKMDATIQRFMGPYLVEIKTHIRERIVKFQSPDHGGTAAQAKGHLLLSRTTAPSGAHGSWIIPPHAHEHVRELAIVLEAIRKLLMVRLACGTESTRWMVSIGSQAVWKGMLVFSMRQYPLPPHSMRHRVSTAQPSVPSAAVLAHAGEYSHSTSLGLRGARHILKTGKRSPSPPSKPEVVVHNELMLEVKSFWVVMNYFVKDIASLSPTDGNELSKCSGQECELCGHGFLVNNCDDGDLVREAMKEALEALSALQLVMFALCRPERLRASLAGCLQGPTGSVSSGEACVTLTRALQELPPLILLHLLASRVSKESGFRLPHEVWGESFSDYEAELPGFVAAERWTPEVAHEMVVECGRLRQAEERRRGMSMGQEKNSKASGEKVDEGSGEGRWVDDKVWMDMLGLAIESEVESLG